MAGRIVATVLALITVLLTVVAVPLGLTAENQDRREFRDNALADAVMVANVAEERIDDSTAVPALGRAVQQLDRLGDRVTVYDLVGRVVAGTPGAPVRRGRQLPGRLLVAVPVLPDSGVGRVGTVVLSRSTAPVDHTTMRLWTLISLVTAAGLVAAAAVAAGLARWVSRPLTTLDGAARRLGSGNLDARSGVTSGPAEVRRLSETFDTMAARIQSLVHGHRAMMADVSHQVRTPLAALRLRLDLLAQDADGPTATELAGAQEEIARLSRLVSGLLAVARAESVTAVPAPVAVDAVIADRTAAWRPAAEERGVALAAAAAEPVGALACPGHLEQILDNLIANALDALTDGGEIEVGVTAAQASAADTEPGRGPRGVARITVRDNGCGMSPEAQAGAFRRFATGDSGGIGLGLAIVDRLTAANGGSAALSDTPGGGLTVTVELPRAAAPAGSRRPGGGRGEV